MKEKEEDILYAKNELIKLYVGLKIRKEKEVISF